MNIGCGHVPGLAEYEYQQAELGRLGNEADEAWRRGDCADETVEELGRRGADVVDAIWENAESWDDFVAQLYAAGAGKIVAEVQALMRERYEPRDPRPDRYGEY